MSDDEQLLLHKYKEIKKHGFGKLNINVHTTAGKLSVTIDGGKTNKFTIELTN